MPKFRRKTKEERQKEIQEAAKKVFLKKGFRNTTMEDVIKETSLSKGGVYQYYKSTKTILFDIMQSGNYFRYERSEQIIHNLMGSESPVEIITQVILAKIFDVVPEKKLYLMFLSEILYDKDYEKLFSKLEKQAIKLFIKNMHLNRESEEKMFKILNTQGLLISKILNGILIVHELFSDKQVFTDGKQKIHDLIFGMVQDFWENNKFECTY